MTTDPTTSAPKPVQRCTVQYFLQSLEPDGTWENSSSGMDDDEDDYARERLAMRRKSQPEFEHRIVRQTTTTTIEQEPIDA